MVLFCYAMLYLFVFAIGVSFGSFLNVVIYRLPAGMNIAKGRSFCPSCRVQIKNYDLIPIVSYLILGGKCRACKHVISPRYLIIELVCGLAAMGLFWCVGDQLLTLAYFLLFCLLLSIMMIDIDTMTIPDSLWISVAVLGVGFCFLQPEIGLVARLIGIVVVSVPMLLLSLAQNGAFGGGDIKLMAAAGLLLGYQNTLLAMFFACVAGGIFGIFLLCTKRAERKSAMSFGPFLSIGIMIAALFGTSLLTWYCGLL